MLLAGILLKMGGYGIIRFGAGLFPEQVDRFGLLLAILAAINVIYGALLVLQQKDLKRLSPTALCRRWATSCSASPRWARSA